MKVTNSSFPHFLITICYYSYFLFSLFFTSSYVHSFSTTTTTTTTSNTIPTTINTNNKNNNNKNEQKIPFVIERLGRTVYPKDSAEISDLVINVFFKEEAEKQVENRIQGSITPWRAMQLAYLANLNSGDIRSKKLLLGNKMPNEMFVARKVIPQSLASSSSSSSVEFIMNKKKQQERIITDLSTIYNQECLSNYFDNDSSDDTLNTDIENIVWVKGDVVGFVDITARPFGIVYDANDATLSSTTDSTRIGKKSKSGQIRPVLSNLSVKEEARKSGVGSKLVQICEEIILNEWSTISTATDNNNNDNDNDDNDDDNFIPKEMILEVEEENIAARLFYEKRGYKAVFADPTARRYDTSGLILQNVRTTKVCYCKDLTKDENNNGRNKGNQVENVVGKLMGGFLQIFQGGS